MWKPKDFTEYMNKRKGHLHRLPPVPKERWQKRYEGASKECVILYNIYSIDNLLKDWIVQSACWGKYSWERNTDARDHDIKIAFYVEHSVADIVNRVLQASHIDVENDVFYFDTDETNEGRFSKKHMFITDPQFKEYKWVIQCDADVFAGATKDGDTYNRMPFFQKMQTWDETQIGAMHVSGSHKKIEEIHWINQVKRKPEQQIRQAWLDVTTQIAGDDIAKQWTEGIDIQYPNGGMYAIPMSYFRENRADDLLWLYEAGQLYRDDEMTFSMWEYMSEKNTLFDICEIQGVPFTHNRNLEEIRPTHQNYLLHYLGDPAELFFREDIGAPV